MPFNKNQLSIDSAVPKEEFLYYLAKYGVLAASSHNTQPWKLEVSSQKISVFPNWERRLNASDKENRQLWISVGACIGNILLAAESYGLKYFIEGETNIIFQDLQVSNEDKQTLQAIIARSTNRLAFNEKPIPLDILNKFSIPASRGIEFCYISDTTQKEKVKKVVSAAVLEAFADKNFRAELSNWIKPSMKKVEDGMPGYILPAPKLISFILPTIIKYVNVGKMQSKMHQLWLNSAPTYVVISTRDDKSGWLLAGEYLSRFTVFLEKEGIRNGIIGAPIEVNGYYEELKEIIGAKLRPQLFLRIGYAPPTPYVSPRLDLTKTISKV